MSGWSASLFEDRDIMRHGGTEVDQIYQELGINRARQDNYVLP